MKQRWNILLKGLAAIGAVIVICISTSRLIGIGSETLGDIAQEHPQPTTAPRETPGTTPGTTSGAEPGTTPGTEPGATPGTEPGTTPGATPGAKPLGTMENSSMTPGVSIGASQAAGESSESPGPLTGEPSETTIGASANVSESGNDAYNMESLDAVGTEKDTMNDNIQNLTGNEDGSFLTGLSLNGELMTDARITWEDGFYYEPLSDDLAEYITGVSYPANLEKPAITLNELSYVHVLYRNFDGDSAEGELICNQSIAQDLVEIFHELYKAEYQIEKIHLIDTYGGDDDLSMADNNTSCFNYRVVSGSSSLSRHAYGLAIDINPLYNPYITYNKDQTINVSPAAGEDYADRSKAFPYKIDEDDLCYRLFKEHGFTWGGNWNSCKDYQHFQKTP